jgi:hypothetical protein
MDIIQDINDTPNNKQNYNLNTVQDILERYYLHALRLLEFREYLEHRRSAIKNSIYIPYCLKPMKSNNMNYNQISKVPERINIDIVNKLINYGGVYIVKNGRLIELPKAEIITNITEIFSKFDTYNISKRDYQLELQQFFEDNLVKLSASGTVYTALPLSGIFIYVFM